MEEIMNFKRIVFGLIFSIATVVLIFAQTFAEPVLIKLTLEKPSDWSNATSLGVVAYQRFDNFVVAEFESERLGELDKLDLRYEIIDEEPWSEEYFLVSVLEGVPEVNLELYGKVLLEGPKWQLIKTSRERAFELMPMGYKVAPIHHRPIPLEYKPAFEVTKEAPKYSADIDSLVNLVSEDSLYVWDLRLQNFQTRYSYTDSIHAARQWIFDKFVSFGIDSVWFHHYYWDSDQYNVVATVVGTAQPDKVIVVGGHYDSVVYGDGTNPYVWAPGADDNGSGTVGTLEMARIIAQNPLPVTVMFVPFAQEEQGLIGSYYFAGYLSNNNADVQLMINSDMIGHSVDSDPDVEINAAATAIRFANIMMDMANTYTYLNPFYGGQTYGSDHHSFFQWGYNAVSTFEGDFFENGIHTNYDVVDSLDFNYMREVVKMCLATTLNVGHSPSSVENLKAVDAGDGHTIYLSWSASPPEEDVVYYNVYFGFASGNYDSLHQVYVTSDTLRNLEENTTYFMTVTAVNADGFESAAINEVSMTPRTVPLPPTGLVANPDGSFKVKLIWLPNQEADFDYYNIYRSEESGSGYQLLFGACQETTFVDSTVQGGVEYYYYTLTAVDTSGNESEMSDEAQSPVVSLDQGLLLVDETYINSGYNMVDGDSINAFYDRALQDYTYTYADHSYPNGNPPNQISVAELSRYSVVIVHSEDHRESYSMGVYGDSTYSVLKEYLSFGGKVIIEGRRNLSTGQSIDCGMREFLPGDVPYDYLRVKSAYVPCWSPGNRTEEFIGAFSQVPEYPDLQVDSLRVAQCAGALELAGRVPGVGYIDSLMAGEVIYTFHSDYDTSSSEGKPVAFRYLGEDCQVIFFDFPLYFIQEPQATQLLHKALSDLGIFSYMCGDANGDQVVDIADVVYLVNYLFIDGDPPNPLEAGDVNQDEQVDIADVVYLLNYLFGAGDPPCEGKQEPYAKIKPVSAEVGISLAKMDEGGAAIFIDAGFDVDIAAMQVEIEWDKEKLELSDILRTSRTQKLGLYHNSVKDGELRIGVVDLNGKELIPAGKGALLRLNMKSKAASLDLSILEIKQATLVDRKYPNPFNPQTVIQYSLPSDCEVQITIYNILGQRVKALINEHQEAGYKRVEWDSKNDRGEEVASGIYFYQIKAGEFAKSKKMVILK
jgi:hypothetical protein